MEKSRSLAELLASETTRDSGIVLRVPEGEKQNIQRFANSLGFQTVSDFIRHAIYYFAWATSDVELRVHGTNTDPEYIDLINTASYDIYLANYLITDDTFDSDGARTNVHRHSFLFGPLVFETLTGTYDAAILRAGAIVRVYSGQKPAHPPAGIAIWTCLPGEMKIWNNRIERVTIYRIARKHSEDIIAGIPSRHLEGLRALIDRGTREGLFPERRFRSHL